MRKISLAVVICVMFVFMFCCGNARALPQDWPCKKFEVLKTNVVVDDGDGFEYLYRGEDEKYIVVINLLGSHKFPTLFANCGTAGCVGKITEKTTNRTENLRFFCEEYNDDYSVVKCVAGLGDEAYFDKENDDQYILHYCIDDMSKTLRFNKVDCEKCHCKMSWYEGDVKKEPGEREMTCEFLQKKAHCYTPNGYVEHPDFAGSIDDYDNCVGLEM